MTPTIAVIEVRINVVQPFSSLLKSLEAKGKRLVTDETI